MLGPIMLDVAGTELTPEDEARLRHPLTGGVILFSKNFANPAQLAALTTAIHNLRTPHLLIAVDHEGGRVQRFQDGFTKILAMRELGTLWDQSKAQAKQLATQAGYVLAAELRAHGVDFSFTPVLDLDYGESGVIGDRALHRYPQAVSDLAQALIAGLKKAGMSSVGKHFPGHGFVRADSHLEVPVDDRALVDLELEDLVPFRQLSHYGMTAIMPAHVIYPKVDSLPAGYSSIWLKQILRTQLEFDGVIFSDDLSMEGARIGNTVVDRAHAALTAGCDMVLLCNDGKGADELLAGLQWEMSAVSLARMARMHGKPNPPSMIELREQTEYVESVRAIAGVGMRSGDLLV